MADALSYRALVRITGALGNGETPSHEDVAALHRDRIGLRSEVAALAYALGRSTNPYQREVAHVLQHLLERTRPVSRPRIPINRSRRQRAVKKGRAS